ncbi:MAG: hypothetical protein AB7I59_30930, partial [Geminicoccaceae bacterium]
MTFGDYLAFNLNGESVGTPSPQPTVQVKIIDNGDGTLTFQVLQAASGTVGDISAFWFDVANESLIGSLSAAALPSPTGTGTPTISLKQGDDNVQALNGQDNLQGVGYGSDGGFDVGIEVNQTPDRIDDYLSFSFRLSSATQPLSLSDFQNVDFAIRITSTGPDTDLDGDGDGGGSWKILGSSPNGMPAMSIDKVVTGVFNADGSADEDGQADAAGDYVTYDITVANIGNITLTGVAIDDPLLGGA